MDSSAIKSEIRRNAVEINRLHQAIKETFVVRNKGPEHKKQWQQACQDFHTRFNSLAFPGGYADAVQRVESGDPDAVEAALSFLEVRPYFFRSGYLYKALIPKLRRADLTAEQHRRFSDFLSKYQAWQLSRKKNTL